VENYNLPKTEVGCMVLAIVIGTDGWTLLDALEAAAAPRWLREIPAVQTLRRVWAEQYIDVDGTLVWRDVQEMPSPAELLPQLIERGALRTGEGLATDGTAIALIRLAMHAHVPLSPLPSARALGVMAELGLRVHRRPPYGRDLAIMGRPRPAGCPKDPLFFKPSNAPPRLNGVVPMVSSTLLRKIYCNTAVKLYSCL
jgi:hypothetical protein